MTTSYRDELAVSVGPCPTGPWTRRGPGQLIGDEWATRFIDGGPDEVTVQSEPGADVNHTLVRIRARKARPPRSG
jgi:hypothetical protein